MPIEVRGEDALRASLRDRSNVGHDLLFQNNNQQSLLRLMDIRGTLHLLHYDVMGRPMTANLQRLIQETLPNARIDDVSRAERMAAMQQGGGEFNFVAQAHPSVENAMLRLNHRAAALEVAEVAQQRRPLLAGLFGRRAPAGMDAPAAISGRRPGKSGSGG